MATGAAAPASVVKWDTCHTYRRPFATRPLEDGYDARVVREVLVHSGVWTTMIYAHVLNQGGRGARSPADVR